MANSLQALARRLVEKIKSRYYGWKWDRELRQLTKAGWPDALIKSTYDHYSYAVRLKSGATIYFSEAAVGRSVHWAILDPGDQGGYPEPSNKKIDGCLCPRGLEVRVSEIVWAADSACAEYIPIPSVPSRRPGGYPSDLLSVHRSQVATAGA